MTVHIRFLMAFRRRSSRLGLKINRLKHVVDVEGALSGGVNSISTIANAVNERGASFNPSQVLVGSTINAFYITLFVIGATGAPLNGAIQWYIAKQRIGQNNITDFPDPDNVGVSDIRNQIFHQEKGLAGSGDGTAMVFKGVIVVPKIYRRQRAGDQFFIKLNSNDVGNDAQFCIQVHYNEFN